MGHANARLTVHGRALLVERVLIDRRPVAHVAKELGVSRQCAHRWVARFRAEGPGGKAHGRVVGSASRDRATRVGFDYVHCLVDDHSRLAYSEILPDEKGATCAGFLQRAAAYFADHGITRIERVMTDNAWAYRWSLREICAALGARQKFIKPHCPWQNGKAERFNRTLQTEWAYRRPYTSNTDRAAALTPWLERYNTQRHHTALGGQPPITRTTSPT